MVDWNVIAGEVITAVLKIVLPVCVALVIKWAAELWLKVKADKPELAGVLDYAASFAVRAVEQTLGDVHGKEKRDQAVKIVVDFLKKYGLSVDVETIINAVEAAVFDMNREGQQLILESPEEKHDDK